MKQEKEQKEREKQGESEMQVRLRELGGELDYIKAIDESLGLDSVKY